MALCAASRRPMARRPSPIPPDWNPLDALQPGAREALGADDRRALADYGAGVHRRARERSLIGLPGGVPCPPFLQRVEADAPGAARLYVSLDGERFTVERAVEAGTFLQLDRAAVEAALGALRRAELVGDAGGVLVTLPPGGLPF